ncbi:MAG: ABC transporter permease [Candidatus Limnocylindria bacterium]
MANTRLLHRGEYLLLGILGIVALVNSLLSPFYLGVDNIINLFELSVEKIIVVVAMTFVIISGEIDLSVASVMVLGAAVLAVLSAAGLPFELAIAGALLAGVGAGLFQGFFVAILGMPSLVVTLAGLVGFRGLARILVEDRSVGDFPAWFEQLGQEPLVGPVPFSVIFFVVLIVVAGVILQRTAFGRSVYVIGNNANVARYSGINVSRVKLTVFAASGLAAALGGVLFAARVGTVQGNLAEGFELDIITMVLLGGVSIFGGSGRMVGVALAVLIVLNLRNGLGLANVGGAFQAGTIGALLILSVLVPNLTERFLARRRGSAPGPSLAWRPGRS